ncbi:MAG TPA: PGF-CTERM sorting domain-containing protein, partial [Methanocorpusculum sp.]|nr:PGF-CTERM sorting domain-containing protein [Methanocorpusculum sp.]
IGAEGADIVLNETANVYVSEDNTVLFNVSKRQTANAAQALCDALDSQNIDDMYVKASFFVVGKDESFTISEIPTTIAQGETLTISGVSTANADGTVTVEMISTAFAAVPKETVGSAAFIAVSTKVAEDGTWEITMDTSDLNVDEYSLKVAVTPANGGETETWKNVNINVVEAADEPVTPPTDEPGQDEPGQDEPVAPETPGFGALAALAGLGAVAVLLLRRE